MNDFWDFGSADSGPPVTDEVVREAEQALGYRLPSTYVELLRTQNGGYPRRKCHPLPLRPRSRQPDFVHIYRLICIGERGNPSYSLEMIPEWEYPNVGFIIADTDSGGHDVVLLDYTECGPEGEPRVIHVETECEVPRIKVLAPDFATFAANLVECP